MMGEKQVNSYSHTSFSLGLHLIGNGLDSRRVLKIDWYRLSADPENFSESGNYQEASKVKR